MSDGDTIVQRPWGDYVKLYQESGVWVKRVKVKPGARLSLQRHHKRSEKWIVVAGKGLAVLGEEEVSLEKGSVLDIPVETEHRIGNVGEDKLVFIEVACRDYLGEDDISRIQDDYSRTAS